MGEGVLNCVLVIMVVITGVGLIALPVLLIIHPSPELATEVLTGTTGTLHLTLLAHNANARAGVSYRWLDAGVWHNGTYLAGGQARGFSQDPGEKTRVLVAARAAPAVPRGTEERIALARAAGKKLAVDVHVAGKVRFRYGAVRTRWHTLRTSCPGVAVVDPAAWSPTTKSGGVYCYVHV